MRRIQLLLSTHPDSSLLLLESGLNDLATSLLHSLPASASVTASIALADDPTPGTVLGQRVTGSSRHRFDGMLRIDSETAGYDDLVSLLLEPVAQLRNVCDLEHSAAVAGEVHLIVPGDDHLLFLYPLRRKPEFTHQAFLDYWFNVHSEHGRAAPGLHGYRQLHTDLDATRSACERLGVGIDDLDGVAESANSDLENFLEVMSTSVTAGVGTDDTSAFIDQDRSAVFLTRVLTPVSEAITND